MIHESHISEIMNFLSVKADLSGIFDVDANIYSTICLYSTYHTGSRASWTIKVLLQYENVIWEIPVIM